MNEKYLKWVHDNFPTAKAAALQCAEATQRIVEAFPELKRVRGHITLHSGSRHQHWWTVAPDGWIIDPTVCQYESRPFIYEPLPDDAEEPLGKCLNCGAYCFRSEGAISSHCGGCVALGNYRF